jgi:peptidoglycan DL-endopeptidase CwlO
MVLAGILLLAVPTWAPAAERTVTTTHAQRTAAADAAAARTGSPYHRGATGPRRFDCSGLIAFAFDAAGVRLAARSSFDLWNIGAPIRRAALRRGDLVWTWDRSKGHVGIYLGHGRYVHAPGPGRRVQVAPLPSGSAFIGAVRP